MNGARWVKPANPAHAMLRLATAAALIIDAVIHLQLASDYQLAAAAVVAASALAAVLLYRYVDVPAIGPIPSMYEPLWFTKKTITTLAEAAGTLTALAGLATIHRTIRNTRAPVPAATAVTTPTKTSTH